MRAAHRRSTGRGRLALTVSAVGLTLVVGGAAVARVAEDASLPGRAPAQRQADVPAYVVEPAVRFEAVVPPGPSRTRPLPRVTGVPRRLVVPRLGVDAPVVDVGAARRVLLPPDDPQVLGWWRGGARPGEPRGSTLITGHTVSSGGGAFDDLDRLGRGDRVRVRTTAGVVGYVVERTVVFRKGRLARQARKVFSQAVPGRLVLVTCADWNGSAYLSNTVVFARPAGGRRG